MGISKESEANMRGLRCLVLCTAVIFLSVSGCEPDGRVGPSQSAMRILCGDDGISNGWFVYEDMFGGLIEQEGVAMITHGGETAWYESNNGVGGVQHNWCNGVQHIESSGITGEGGRCNTRGKRDDWKMVTGYYVQSGMSLSKPDSPGTNASFSYATLATNKKQIARASGDGVVAAADAIGYTSLVVSEDSIMTISGDGYAPSYIKPLNLETIGNLTQAEYDALLTDGTDSPSFGISWECRLISQNGSRGNGYCREMNSIMAINLENPEHYLRYAGPFMYSYIFKTASAQDIVGSVFSAMVKTDKCADGVEVDLFVIGSSEDMKTHVARTEYFLPVSSDVQMSLLPSVDVYDRWNGFDDPNIWDPEQYEICVKEDWLSFIDPNLYSDPNIVPDPNVLFDPENPDLFDFYNRLDTSLAQFEEILIPERIISVKIVPMYSNNDYVRVQFNPNSSHMIFNLSDAWLGDDRAYDMNRDGIVNFKDWLF